MRGAESEAPVGVANDERRERPYRGGLEFFSRLFVSPSSRGVRVRGTYFNKASHSQKIQALKFLSGVQLALVVEASCEEAQHLGLGLGRLLP